MILPLLPGEHSSSRVTLGRSNAQMLANPPFHLLQTRVACLCPLERCCADHQHNDTTENHIVSLPHTSHSDSEHVSSSLFYSSSSPPGVKSSRRHHTTNHIAIATIPTTTPNAVRKATKATNVTTTVDNTESSCCGMIATKIKTTKTTTAFSTFNARFFFMKTPSG